MKRMINEAVGSNLMMNFMITEALYRSICDLKGWENVYQMVAMHLKIESWRQSLDEISSIAAVLVIIASKQRREFSMGFEFTRDWKILNEKELGLIRLELLRHGTLNAIWSISSDATLDRLASRASAKGKMRMLFQRDFDGMAMTASDIKSLFGELVDLANRALKSGDFDACMQTYEKKYPLDRFCHWASEKLQTALVRVMNKQRLQVAQIIPPEINTLPSHRAISNSVPGAPLKAKKRKRIHSIDRDEVKRNLLMSSFPRGGPMYWDSEEDRSTAQATKTISLILPTETRLGDEDELTDGVFKDVIQGGRSPNEEQISDLEDEDEDEDEDTMVPSPMTAAQRLRTDDDVSEPTFRQFSQQNAIDESTDTKEANKDHSKIVGNTLYTSPAVISEQQDDDFTADSSWAERFKLALWKAFSPGTI